MPELAIIIPARVEMFLARTIQDILEHSETDCEIIAVLDGEWADPQIPQHPRVNVVYVPESIGQRAACNLGVRLTKAPWIMKADAHCSFAQGFDKVLLSNMQDDWTVVPTMRNLWAFSWKCNSCGWKTYQSPTPDKCGQCGRADKLRRKIMWISKSNPQSNAYCFDTDLHFQYDGGYTKTEKYKRDLAETGMTETMSLQGSCWMLTREKYWELNVCDEAWGSWGQQGVEVAVKTWLSGGRVMVNHGTSYAHLFRTNGSFGFPYPISGRQVAHARKASQDLFFNNKWDRQIYPLSWLIERFAPNPYWHFESGKETLDMVNRAGEQFLKERGLSSDIQSDFPAVSDSSHLLADQTAAGVSATTFGGERMTPLTMGLTGIDGRNTGIGAHDVLDARNEM